MSGGIAYRERLWPGLGMPSFLLFMGTSLSIAYQRAYHGRIGLIVFVVSVALTTIISVATSPMIRISEGQLTLGKAHIERRHLGQIALLDPQQARNAQGHGAHAHALTVIRSAARHLVLVEIIDEHDPHPYWMFSTRHPDEVLAALSSG